MHCWFLFATREYHSLTINIASRWISNVVKMSESIAAAARKSFRRLKRDLQAEIERRDDAHKKKLRLESKNHKKKMRLESKNHNTDIAKIMRLETEVQRIYDELKSHPSAEGSKLSPTSSLSFIPIGEIGYEFRKEFDDGWFTGTVVEIYKEDGDRRCKYSDGDVEDLSLADLERLARLDPNEQQTPRSRQGTTDNNLSNKVEPQDGLSAQIGVDDDSSNNFNGGGLSYSDSFSVEAAAKDVLAFNLESDEESEEEFDDDEGKYHLHDVDDNHTDSTHHPSTIQETDVETRSSSRAKSADGDVIMIESSEDEGDDTSNDASEVSTF